MELAKISPKGQITIPLLVRQKLKLQAGGKIAFVEHNGEYKVVNPTKLAIMDAQNAFFGLSDELGLKSEDDVIALCNEVRKEMWAKSNASNG